MNLLIKSGSEKLEKIIDNFKNYDVKITNEVNEKNIANADCLIILPTLKNCSDPEEFNLKIQDIYNTLSLSVEQGIKKVSVACPSFTADCLETLEEIAVENHEDFEKLGGEYVKLIPSLNDNDDWVKSFANYLHDKEFESSTN